MKRPPGDLYYCFPSPPPSLPSPPPPPPFPPLPLSSPPLLSCSQCMNALLLNAPYARLSEPYQTRVASSLKPLLTHRSECWFQVYSMYVRVYHTYGCYCTLFVEGLTSLVAHVYYLLHLANHS